MFRAPEREQEIAERYLARTQTVDRQGPELRSVIETNPEALAIADALDQERKAGKTTVTDAAVLLGALAGMDPRDEATAASQGRAHADYTPFLDAAGLKGTRLGIARHFFGFHEKVDALMEAAIAEMKRQGAEVIDPVDIQPGRELRAAEQQVLLYEFKADLNEYLDGLAASVTSRTLEALIAFNEAHAREEMPYFGQELFVQAEEKGPLTTPEYLDALSKSKRLARQEGIDAVMDQHHLDAIVAPTGGPAWVTDLVNGDHFGGGVSTLPAVAGYRHITVPCGDVFGLPVGISFFGRAWSEPTLIKIAFGFEQATKHRRAPKLLPTADLTV